MSIRNIRVVNLTTAYGQGNEPSYSPGIQYKLFDTAKRVKKIFYGDESGIARKVRKGFIGIAGIARQFFGLKELIKYTSTTISLPTASMNHGTVNFNNKAFFVGGSDVNSNFLNTAIYFNTSLTRTSATNIGAKRAVLAGAANSSYAFFAGGWQSSSVTASNVYAYNTSTTYSTATALSKAVTNLAGGGIGSYAVFAGGWYQPSSGSSGSVNNVAAYNTSKT